jgi:hypothetical protein
MIILLQRAFLLGTMLAVATTEAFAADSSWGRPIEYSEPRDNHVKLDPGSLSPGNTRLDQLESDLNSPFKSFRSGNSLDGLMMTAPRPLPPPAVQSPKSKALINQKRDSIFLKPEEIYSLKSFEDQYKAPELTPDGRKMDDLRPMERRMLESLDANQTPFSTGPDNAYSSPGYNPYNGKSVPVGDSATSGTGNAFDRGLRSLLGTDTDSSADRSISRDAADFFGLNNNAFKPATKLTESELQRRDAFMQIVNPNYTAPVAGATPGSGGFATPYVDSSFYDPPKMEAPKPVITPQPTPPLGGGLNGSALGTGSTPSWSSPYTPPPPVRVNPTPPVSASPFMSIPRRTF